VRLDLGESMWVDSIVVYTGLSDGNQRQDTGIWTLRLSDDGAHWQTFSILHDTVQVFRWTPRGESFSLDTTTRYVRLSADLDGMELGELALIIRDENGDRSLMDLSPLAEKYPQYAALFDEQSLIPALSYLDNNVSFDQVGDTVPRLIPVRNHGMVFDECWHAKTAYEFTRGLAPSEVTHPPLGKVIMALGIKVFGMTPFGWRFMGILFGILMAPLLYVLIKNLFGNTIVAACGTALFAFENMHYTQTHIATIDTFVVFFIIAMYLYMYRYISLGYDTPFKKTLPALFSCGFSFGLGAATKWTAFYAALGLIVLYAVYLTQRGKHQIAVGQKREFRGFLLKTLCASVVCFAIIPLAIYTLSYIPYTTANGHPLTASGLLRDMWDNQVYMMDYHGSETAALSHDFQSRWWEWILCIQPMLYSWDYREGSRALFGVFSNPLVTIGGLVAIVVAVSDFLRTRVSESLVIVVGYLAQIVPWILVSRYTFTYHYFPSVIFLTLAICYVFSNMLKHSPESKRWVYAFTGVSVGIFFLLLPPTAGIPMPDWYSAWFVRWLPSWPF